jgi:hypothetical protein
VFSCSTAARPFLSLLLAQTIGLFRRFAGFVGSTASACFVVPAAAGGISLPAGAFSFLPRLGLPSCARRQPGLPAPAPWPARPVPSLLGLATGVFSGLAALSFSNGILAGLGLAIFGCLLVRRCFGLGFFFRLLLHRHYAGFSAVLTVSRQGFHGALSRFWTYLPRLSGAARWRW